MDFSPLLDAVVVILLLALLRVTPMPVEPTPGPRPPPEAAREGGTVRPLGTLCFACKRKDKIVRTCIDCDYRCYCSPKCKASDWSDHKALCEYLRANRQTTYHNALVLPADGGPACLRRLAFSMEGADSHGWGLFLRAVDLREIFGSEIKETNLHRLTANGLVDESDHGEYIMYYTTSPRLPPNKHLLSHFKLDAIPEGRQFWRGDAVIVKIYERFMDRPAQFKSAHSSGVEVDYFDVKMSFLPTALIWMNHFYEVGFEEAQRWEESLAKFKESWSQFEAAVRSSHE